MDYRSEPPESERRDPEPEETGPLGPPPEAEQTGAQTFSSSEPEAVISEEPAVETPPTGEPAAPPPPPRGRRTGLIVLGGLLLALLLFGGGYLLAYLTQFRPAAEQVSTLQAASAEMQSQLDETSAQLNQRESELQTSQAAAAAAETALSESQNRLLLNNLQNDVLVARLALANEDLLTARQALRLAQSDIDALREIAADGEMVDDLAARLEDARSAMSEDPAAAGVELRLLSDNIVLLQEQFQ